MLTALGQDATAALRAWKTLEETVRRIATGDAVPSTSRVTALLETLRKTAARYVPIEEAAPSAPAMTVLEGSDVKAEHTIPADVAVKSAGRETMLEQILQIAEAFRRSEPNSPFSYTLEEAVRRARLSWPDLLRELMPELPQRASLLTGLGIRPPTE
jgi:type VI secretion system protein ImpA